MSKGIFFDGHCDTISELLDCSGSLSENDLHVDMKRMSEYSSYTQVFAAFIAPKYRENAMARVIDIIEKFYHEANENAITVCKSYDDWKLAKTPVRAFLSVEGGDCIDSLSDIGRLYKMGVRMIAPTWNFSSKIACGVMEKTDTGLSDFGKDAVSEMNRLGIIIDMSHLSQRSFFDIAELSSRPLCASHSCADSVTHHPRNLTDSQFIKIVKSGGVAGINFYPPFVGNDISGIVRHIDRFMSLGGEDNIGLGSDFDGVEYLPKGLCGVQDMDKVIKMLPYSTEIREKIAYLNFLRLIKAHSC